MANGSNKPPDSAANAGPKRKPRTWVEQRVNLDVRDPQPLDDAAAFWRGVAQAATIVMSVLAFGVFLFFARSLLLPILSALVVGLTLGPVISYANKRGIPAWAIALLVVVVLVVAVNIAIVTLAQPITDLVGRAPELGTAIKEKLHILDRPLGAMHELQKALGMDQAADVKFNPSQLIEGFVTIVTPAALQFVTQWILFIGTLVFFIIGRTGFRKYTVNWFASRDARLRSLKILNDIEGNLSGYLVVVTAINLGLGIVTTLGAYLMGLPAPVLWGALAFALNYVPYVGPAIMYVFLFVIGLISYPTLLGALLPPGAFMAVTLIEGQFISPAVVGRQVLNMHPLAIFLSIAFWAWMWGPIGAFLATPILIIARVALDHSYPSNKAELPG